MSFTGNYYTDACLTAAGGKPLGKLDFYQMHTYSNGGNWNPNAPFKVRSVSDCLIIFQLTRSELC
jgi:mannan endo-1,4-beta-mannosidase